MKGLEIDAANTLKGLQDAIMEKNDNNEIEVIVNKNNVITQNEIMFLLGHISKRIQQFNEGDLVFYCPGFEIIPGVISNATYGDNDTWHYEINCGKCVIKNVPENLVQKRNASCEAMFHIGDMVSFLFDADEEYTGIIEVVDKYGTYGQTEEPSYDILVTKADKRCLYKHIRESMIICKLN